MQVWHRTSITKNEARQLWAEELAKPDFDPNSALDRIRGRMNNALPLEVLLADVLPVEWQARLLPQAWAFDANRPSTYAGTDTFVRLFERVGFIADYDDVERPATLLTIFRGVTGSATSLARGLSWTTDLDKARWFSHRLDHLLRLGKVIEPTVWSAEVEPQGVLAMFYGQQELEVVVNPCRLRRLQIVEQSAPVPPVQDDSGIVGIFD